jgi:hypothetical protein
VIGEIVALSELEAGESGLQRNGIWHSDRRIANGMEDGQSRGALGRKLRKTAMLLSQPMSTSAISRQTPFFLFLVVLSRPGRDFPKRTTFLRRTDFADANRPRPISTDNVAASASPSSQLFLCFGV